jgi:nitrogen fixation protein FixH
MTRRRRDAADGRRRLDKEPEEANLTTPLSATSPEAGGRRVTGRTVLAWIVGFFLVIFAANAVLVTLALRSFPGLEVSSSYRAGQEFNDEIAAAAAQAARGWNVSIHAGLSGDTATVVARFSDKAGAPERMLSVTALLGHPTSTRHDQRFVFAETEPGVYTGKAEGVAAGRWNLSLEASVDGERQFLSRNPIVLGR